MRYAILVVLALGCRSATPVNHDEQTVPDDDLRAELRRRTAVLATSDHRLSDAAPKSVRSELSELSDTRLIQLLQARQKSIYGQDDRKELYQADPALQRIGRSVAAIYVASDLQSAPPNMVRLPATTLTQRFGVCDDERFAEQPTLAICTAFVVGPALLMTAAHCVDSDRDDALRDLRFVFGHVMESTGPVLLVPEADVYRGKHVRKRVYTADDADWALVETDRELSDRAPLTVASDDASEGSTVHVQGYPSGLPIKAANRARVRRSRSNAGFFVANLDTFGGNSGSPVFNGSNEVVGILVRGAPDYVLNRERGCKVALQCPDTGCDGEESTKASLFRASLPAADRSHAAATQ